MTVLQILKTDCKKYKKYGSSFFVILFFTQGFWAILQYRIANYFYRSVTLQPFRFLFLSWMLLWQKTIEIFTGISIPASASIGHSFYIGHFGGIIINANAIIGNNCNIAQGVTIGISGEGDKRGVPIIHNNVFIGANSVVAGKIIIDNDVLIGACSMINKSLPENAVALGVPAIIISNKGSKGYI
jgi:serine O-acetyltransferase